LMPTRTVTAASVSSVVPLPAGSRLVWRLGFRPYRAGGRGHPGRSPAGQGPKSSPPGPTSRALPWRCGG